MARESDEGVAGAPLVVVVFEVQKSGNSMNPSVSSSQLPLQASERASFHGGDPAVVNALELALAATAAAAPPANGLPERPQQRHQPPGGHTEEFVVVNLDDGANSSDVTTPTKQKQQPPPKKSYDDVELGQKGFGNDDGKQHVISYGGANNKDGDAYDAGETVCRVCHLGLQPGSSESLELGCACKHDLALCHRDCAEEWFKIRGNTVCEICGETVKNVKIPEPAESMVGWLEADGAEPAATQRVVVRSTAMSRLRYCWQRQIVRNALLAALVVVCTVPWFFRIVNFGM